MLIAPAGPLPAFPRPAFASGPAGPAPAAGFVESLIGPISIDYEEDSIYISWSSEYPNGTVYQIYINNSLKWEDITTHASLPMMGAAGDVLAVRVGAIAAADRGTDYGPTFAAPGNEARIGWVGGPWLTPGLTGFAIYRSPAPNQSVSMARPVATVPASMAGQWGNGYGRGPHGRGPHGRGIVNYQWLSGPLAPGNWTFAVASQDAQGNVAANPPQITLTIAGPPAEALFVNGKRLWLSTYDQPTRVATLTWKNGP